MTPLLDILYKVQEGANKLPPLTDYLDAATDFSFDRYWKTVTNSRSNADEIYKTAFDIVVELVTVMQLADANMEKAALERVPQESCRSCPQVVLCDGAIKAKECTWWARDKTPKDNPPPPKTAKNLTIYLRSSGL